MKGGATIALSYEGMESVTYTVVASSDKELKSILTTMVSGTDTECSLYRQQMPTTVSELKAEHH
ncbi:MAG: hypothetical protein ACLVAT_00380 [Lachnospiraceae bacterium]